MIWISPSSAATFLLIIVLITACLPRPNAGRTSGGGSDIVQPLWAEESIAPTDTPRCKKVVALLIGIGEYDPANGWESVSASHDVTLLSATLRKRGVLATNIHRLTNQQATKTGIKQALQTVADTISKGTRFILLYAGHARRLTDDTGDEADGYDEAIVPYDAPPANQNQPDAYLRDDELNQYLTRIRTALGRNGSLWLLFDACHSQTLNRGQMAQRMRGGVAALGSRAKSRFRHKNKFPMGSDWYEPVPISSQLAPYVLFAASADNSPNFETTDASGQSFGPLTRAVCETWTNGDTYLTLFNRVAVAMARYAPDQQPCVEGSMDRLVLDCGDQTTQPASWHTLGEPIRLAWPYQETRLTNALKNLAFVQQADNHPDLHIDRRNKGYRLWSTSADNPLTGELPLDACIERIRQYFARNVLLQLRQTTPAFQAKVLMQRVAVRTEGGRTVVTDTLPGLTTTGLPTFRIAPAERMLLTITNTGSKATYVTVVDLLPDGTLHVLLPGKGQDAANLRLTPGQSMPHRIQIKEPVGIEVYKILLTPEPIDLESVLQLRGNTQVQHPYEALFQRTYVTRGIAQVPISLSEQTGAVIDVPFGVVN